MNLPTDKEKEMNLASRKNGFLNQTLITKCTNHLIGTLAGMSEIISSGVNIKPLVPLQAKHPNWKYLNSLLRYQLKSPGQRIT